MAMGQTTNDLQTELDNEKTLNLFYRQLLSGETPDTLIHTLHHLFHNPVLLLNEFFVPLVQCGISDHTFLDNSFFNFLEKNAEFPEAVPVQMLNTDFPQFPRLLLAKITFKSKREKGILCILEETSFRAEQDLIYLENICAALSNAALSPRKQEPDALSLSDLILELLKGIPSCPDLYREQLKDLHWKEYEKYYMLSFDKSYKNALPLHLPQLEKLLHTELFEYKNYVIAILGCRRYDEPEVLNLSRLPQFLTEHNLFCGLSHGFFDITKLSIFFRQSVKAIDLNTHYGYNCMICRYDDLMVTQLVDTSAKHSEMDLLYYCHPTVLAIYDYDQTHGTDYLNTLAAYIFSNLSPRLAAQTLYIHPNTMYNRITRLKEEFHINFDDLGMFTKILISIHVMGYLGRIDIKLWDHLYRPFQ